MSRRRWSSPEAVSLCNATGLADPIAGMKRLAANLIDQAGFSGPPFDPAMVASMRNVIDVQRVPMTGAARLLPDGPYLRIEVNQDHSRGKQNFSIDHESSHTLIPTYASAFIDDAETGTFHENNEEELLCDVGAAALLLDPRWLAGFAYEASPSIAFLQDMATTFAASLEATARQLAVVGPWPAAFVFWEEGLRKSARPPAGQMLLSGLEQPSDDAPKLRISRVYCTPSFPYRLYHNKSIADSSLIAVCNETDVLTFGVDDIPLQSNGDAVRLYTENRYAAYRRTGSIRRRVISLLLPIDQQTHAPEVVPTYELETL